MAGLSYKKCVFHVHTPASDDFIKGSDEITPRKFLEIVLNHGIEVLAITDHHSIGWIQPLREANNDLQKETGKSITILPGVELHTPDSVHVLAIFDPEEKIENLETFLGALEIPQGERGHNKYQLKKHGLEHFSLLKLIEEYNGLPILAHAHEVKKGFFKACKGHSIKKEIMSTGGILYEVTPNKVDEVYATCKNTACVIISDVHQLTDFDDSKIMTWIQLAPKPNLTSLKQILFEPKRISLELPKKPIYPRISCLEVNTKYFGHLKLDFNEELNVFIGGRGTGKSLIIEILTFVICSYPFNDPDIKNNYLNKLNAHLINGEKIVIYFENKDGAYRLSRVFSAFLLPTKKSKEIKEYLETYDQNNPPILEKYEVALGKWTKERVQNWNEFLSIDIFTQKCVPDIAQKIDMLLNLIDAQANSLDPEGLLLSSLNELKVLEADLVIIEAEISTAYSNLKNPQELEETVKAQKSQIIELDMLLESDERKKAIKWREQNIRCNKFCSDINNTFEKLPEYKMIIEELPALEKVEGFEEFDLSIAETIRQEALNGVEQIQKSQNDFYSKITMQLKDFEEKWTQKFNEFENLHSNIDTSDDQDSLENRITELKQGLVEIEDQQKDNNSLIADIKNKELIRKQKITSYIDARNRVIKSRMRICELIQSRFSKPGLHIRLLEKGNIDPITLILSELFKSMTFQNKQEIFNALARELDPNELYGLFTTGESISTHMTERLISKGIPQHLINKFRTFSIPPTNHAFKVKDLDMIDSETILSLQHTFSENVIMLEYLKGDQWKEFSHLSPGEKCALILQVLLVIDEKILVIDQPEDELDYSSRKDLIDILNEKKRKRQIIFVTHFQNIPVLADANLIIKTDEIDNKGRISNEGCFEEMIPSILELEGGSDAFKIRAKKYHSSLIEKIPHKEPEESEVLTQTEE